MNAKQKTVFTNDCLEALVMVVDRAESSGNCGVCGLEDDNHEAECPYPLARKLLESAGLYKGDKRHVGE